nr:DUF2066 domain-containing protein [Parahaliea mediterranea]
MRTRKVHRENGVIRLVAQWSAVVLLACWLAAAARAEVVGDLYTGQVPVADRSQQELARAASAALAEVLVKVSGSAEVLDLPEVAASLDNALSQAQQFSYARTGDEHRPLAARFEFDRGWVGDLLTRAGAPIWTANRPAVLLWLVQDTARGREFVNRDSAPELLAQLEADFERRGVPLRLPLYDLADAAALSAEQAWRLNTTALRQASSRYGVGEILAGRMTQLSSGQWLGDWAYLSAHGRIDRSATPESVERFLASGVGLVAEDMARRYAVAAGAAPASGVAMSVANVRSYADYAAIVTWLEGLELIEHANVEQVRGDRLELRLRAQADAARLAAIIELNRHLVPVGGAVDGELSYQWRN